jgi:hypothetical protein
MSKQFKNIDELYRSQFDKFQKDPPEYIWEKIKENLNSSLPGGVPKPVIKGGIAGMTSVIILVLVVSVWLIFIAFPKKDPGDPLPDIQTLVPGNLGELIAGSLEDEQHERFELIFSEQKGIGTISQMTKPGSQKKVASGFSGKPGATDENFVAEKTAKTSLLSDGPMSYKKPAGIAVSSSRQGYKPYLLPSLKSSDVEIMIPPERKRYRERGNLMLGLFFTPEIMFYKEDEHLKNYGKSLDLNILYRKSNIILQTGLGVSRISDAGQHRITYNKYLGSYQHVSNVVFDSVGNELVITYITETVNVYDSISYIRVSPTDRQFTYLQIPFLAGFYRECNRFQWYLKAGPSLSLKLHENIPAASVGEDQFRLLNVENNLPGKIDTHWQFIFSTGASYRLGNKVSLSVEPVFRFYINSDYERNAMSTRHPYSLGLKTGLLLDL